MDPKKHPATKEASLNLVKDLVGMHPKQITRALPDIVPAVSGCMNDSKQSVKVSSWLVAGEKCDSERDSYCDQIGLYLVTSYPNIRLGHS